MTPSNTPHRLAREATAAELADEAHKRISFSGFDDMLHAIIDRLASLALPQLEEQQPASLAQPEPAPNRLVSNLVHAACLQEREPSEANQNAYRAARDAVEAALAAPRPQPEPAPTPAAQVQPVAIPSVFGMPPAPPESETAPSASVAGLEQASSAVQGEAVAAMASALPFVAFAFSEGMEGAEGAGRSLEAVLAKAAAMEDAILIPRGLVGAACSALERARLKMEIDDRRRSAMVLDKLRHYTIGNEFSTHPAPPASASTASRMEGEQ